MVTHIGIKTPSSIPKVHLKLERISRRSSLNPVSVLVSRWFNLVLTSSRMPSTLAIRSSSDVLCSMPNLLYHNVNSDNYPCRALGLPGIVGCQPKLRAERGGSVAISFGQAGRAGQLGFCRSFLRDQPWKGICLK